MDMEKFNLFGVPLSELDSFGEEEEQSHKERNRKRKFVRELIETLERLDTDQDPDGIGLMQDFEKPKSFVHFDPYADFDDKLHNKGMNEIINRFDAL